MRGRLQLESAYQVQEFAVFELTVLVTGVGVSPTLSPTDELEPEDECDAFIVCVGSSNWSSEELLPECWRYSLHR